MSLLSLRRFGRRHRKKFESRSGPERDAKSYRALAPSVNPFVEKFCHRTFPQTGYTEVIPVLPAKHRLSPRCPFKSWRQQMGALANSGRSACPTALTCESGCGIFLGFN
jgi:hypothetical protein